MKIIDLSLSLHEGMMTFPSHWHPVVEISILGRHGIEGRETRKLVLGTHTGTHTDAPLHFIPNGKGIDEVPLEVLVGEATVAHSVPPSRTRRSEFLRSRISSAPGFRLV